MLQYLINCLCSHLTDSSGKCLFAVTSMSAVKWAGTEISLRKSYFIIMAPAIITLYTLSTKHIECLNNNIAMAKNGHEPNRIFTVNPLAIPTAWALAGQIAERVCRLKLWISFDLPISNCSLNFLQCKENLRVPALCQIEPSCCKTWRRRPKKKGKVMRILLRMSPLNNSRGTEGGFPPVKSDVTEVGQPHVPWTTTGSRPGAGALLLLKLPPFYFHFRAATFSLFPSRAVMCVCKPACPSSAKSVEAFLLPDYKSVL